MQASRGKTHNLPHVDAGFIKHTLMENGGLRGHVPARPGCTTPQIRFLYIAPCFCVGLPSHPASRQRSCPFASLRLLLYLARRLPLRKLRAMPGTHVHVEHFRGPRVKRAGYGICSDVLLPGSSSSSVTVQLSFTQRPTTGMCGNSLRTRCTAAAVC